MAMHNSEGLALAQVMFAVLGVNDRNRLYHATSLQWREGFLFGRFGKSYSAVAIYNAARHIGRVAKREYKP